VSGSLGIELGLFAKIVRPPEFRDHYPEKITTPTRVLSLRTSTDKNYLLKSVDSSWLIEAEQLLLLEDEAASARVGTEGTEAVVIVVADADVEDGVLQRARRRNGSQLPSLGVLSRQER
jgi:hypothetical protein